MAAQTRSVVPAHPYSTGLMWLLTNNWDRARSAKDAHPYYQALYGAQPDSIKSRAAALACLFETIILPPVDAPLPDHRIYLKDRHYYHPDLRLKMSYEAISSDAYNHIGMLCDILVKSEEARVALLKIVPESNDDSIAWNVFRQICDQVRTAE
ncbi:MAG: hypothetical protein OXR84_06260 [Magnetovibrio sp.]|nr:hypothetical protein [Magnetovibrio sp.]